MNAPNDDRPAIASAQDRARRRRDAERAIKRLATHIREHHAREPDKLVHGVCEDAYVVAEFVADLRDPAKVGPRIDQGLTDDATFLDGLVTLRRHAVDLESTLRHIAGTGSREGMNDRLTAFGSAFRDGLETMLKAFVQVVDRVTAHDPDDDKRRERALELAERIDGRRYQRALLTETEENQRRTREELRKARRANTSAEEMASGAATHKLAEHFHRDSEDEARTADWLRGLAIGALVAVTGIAILLLVTRSDQATVAGELLKLSLTIPVAGLSAYLAHESTRHRTASRASADLAVALNTLESYIAGLDADEVRQFRHALGMRIFAQPGVESPTGAEEASVIDDVHRILVRVEELLGGGRSGP